ncbi:uncharacterized protein LOC143062739 [Mytilus galloprovincialis]|uniref:uncharacterized protein LOC143062739 n=1 Tax=Mytilus galloprovincialis TaxID=29158 RepID=UPI003F7CAE68
MGGICDKQQGSKKLHKLNIRTYNPKVRPEMADGLNEIPLWEKTYEKYDKKQLAHECSRLQTEIKGRLDRLKKVDESLTGKEKESKEIIDQITEAEKNFAKINETSKLLINSLKRQTTMLKENHTYETNKEI